MGGCLPSLHKATVVTLPMHNVLSLDTYLGQNTSWVLLNQIQSMEQATVFQMDGLHVKEWELVNPAEAEAEKKLHTLPQACHCARTTEHLRK